MKYSIIIPIYNVEKYLSRCLDSILSQSYDNYEIICINDGSTDSSRKILESYIDKDSRIKLINQKNKGLGEARNTGITHAVGDYIWFIDSDDWIPDPNALLKINNKIHSDYCDVLMFDYYYGDAISYSRCSCLDLYINEPITYLDYIRYSLRGNLRFFAWLKIFKSDILKINNFKFPCGWYEDIPIISLISKLPQLKISYLRESLYHYFNRPGSIMNSYDSRLLHLIDRTEVVTNELLHITELKEELITFYNASIATTLIRSHKSNCKDSIRENLKTTMRTSYFSILGDQYLSLKRKLLLIVFMVFPLNIFNKVF